MYEEMKYAHALKTIQTVCTVSVVMALSLTACGKQKNTVDETKGETVTESTPSGVADDAPSIKLIVDEETGLKQQTETAEETSLEINDGGNGIGDGDADNDVNDSGNSNNSGDSDGFHNGSSTDMDEKMKSGIIDFSSSCGTFSIASSDGKHTAVVEDGTVVSDNGIIVRDIRPTNLVSQATEYSLQFAEIGGNEYYRIQYDNDDFISCSAITYDNPTNGFYLSIESDGGGIIDIYGSGKVCTDFGIPTEQNITVTKNGMQMEDWYSIEIMTEDSGVTAYPQDDKNGYFISTDSHADSCITVSNALNDIVFDSILIGSDGIVVKDTDDGICGIFRDEILETQTEMLCTLMLVTNPYAVTETGLVNSTTVAKNAPVILPVPSVEGAEFDGWYTDAEFTQPFVDGDVVTKDTYLYAKWR